MPEIFFVLLKVILFSGILLGYYWIALRNKIYHQYNRFYLLVSIIISLIIPFVKISFYHSNQETAATGIQLLKVISTGNEYLDEIIVHSKTSSFNFTYFPQLLYILISIVFSILFFQSLLRIRKLYRQNIHEKIHGIILINTAAPGTPFSFFNCVFWNPMIDINSADGKRIFDHELTHVYQKHSLDKIFINIILLFLWFNPFFWIIRKELNLVHEFIADEECLKGEDSSAFASMILQTQYPYKNLLTNQFFYSPIKRRLAMITQNKNLKTTYVTRLLALPLLFLIISAFTFKATFLNSNYASLYNGETFTVVIDAGHGGTDYGAVSIAGNTLEKDLTLDIAKKIKEANSNDKINIVLTRDADNFISPQQRVTLAKDKKASLFISLHVDVNENNLSNSGLNVLVAKDKYSVAEKSKLFASAVINQFKTNYDLPVSSNPIQKQQGVWVLQANECPSVLVEAGVINNQTDLKFLESEKGKQSIAMNILSAIENYASTTHNVNAINASASESNVYSRRQDSTPDLSKTLVILNGEEISYQKFSTTNPESFESINVLKGETATKKYGNKGKNGVIIIETKKDIPVFENKNNAVSVRYTRQDDKIFTKVENEAEFSGGNEAWKKYLVSKLDARIPIKEGWKPGKYEVVVEFIVDKDGEISNVKTINYEGTKTAAHCINLIQRGPKWVAAKQNGHAVNSYRRQPITFIIE